MSGTLNDFSSDQLEVLREIGNIGAGNATTALASMLDKRLSMSVPVVKIVPFNEITDILNGPENIVIGVMINMSGDLKGYVLLVLDSFDAHKMVCILTGETYVHTEDLDPSTIDLSTLSEIANILVGAYLSAISAMTGLTIIQSVPELTIDMAAAIMSVPAIDYGAIGDSVLFLGTQFADQNEKINGHFFLIPDFDSYKVLLKSLGLQVE